MSGTAVVAAVIQRDGRYLLGRRPEHKRHGGLWEFPGGKVLAGESLENAVRRELDEELGLSVDTVGAVRFTARDDGAPFVIEFVATVVTGDPEAREHTELAWVDCRELLRLPLAPADARFAATLQPPEGAPR